VAVLPRNAPKPTLLLGARLTDTPKSDRERFDAVTYQQVDPKPDVERQEKHEFRVFWLLGVPLGLIAAFFLALATNMGNAGFFIAWVVFAAIIGGFFSSLSRKR